MLTKTLLAATAALACCAAGADTIHLGTFDGGSTPLAFDHKGALVGSDTPFTDQIQFNLASMNDLSASFTFANGPNYAMSLDSWTLALAGVGAISPDAGSSFSAMTYTDLVPGQYQLTIHGTLLAGFHGDSYGGNIAATVVPEPASSALALAGLGALGLFFRRRSRG